VAISTVLAILIGLFFFMIHAILVGALFFFLAFEGYKSWKEAKLLTQNDRDDDLQKLLEDARECYKKSNKEEAIVKLNEVLAKTDRGLLHTESRKLLASIFFQQRQFSQAYELLAPLKDELDGEDLFLLHQLAYSTKHWEMAIEVGNRSYQVVPRSDTALLNALSYALLGQVRPSVGWLQCAVREGLENIHTIVSSSEFDPVRGDPHFQEFIKTLP
jgi:stage IV sporulation protein FB